MRWDDRLMQLAERKANARIGQRKRRIRDAIAADAHWVSVEQVADGLAVKAKGLFRLLLDRPGLRAALRGWA